MITTEILEQLGGRFHMSVFPNIVREYVQHVLLAALYQLPGAEHLLFKGGTALRVVYGSPRFSEDLDFSLIPAVHNTIKSVVERLFVGALAEIERIGIRVELSEKSAATSGGYFGRATFRIMEYPSVGVEINVSSRRAGTVSGEADSIANDFVSTYTVIHLPQHDIVEEKIFSALRMRKKPRDFYDLYFMMRKGMLSADQKKRLSKIQRDIMNTAKNIDFRAELGAFLPADQQAIIRDFSGTLERELNRQLV